MKKVSVTIAGRHNTSFTLEDEFYQELKCIAAAQKVSLNELITTIDSQRGANNLSSSIRIYILQYIKNKFNASKKSA